jgi:hypothetical protein
MVAVITTINVNIPRGGLLGPGIAVWALVPGDFYKIVSFTEILVSRNYENRITHGSFLKLVYV